MRIRQIVTSLAVVPVLFLAACGQEPAAVAVDPSPTGAVFGPETPAATTVGTSLPADQMPTATGGFGEEPTITFPDSGPPPQVQRQTLVEGSGPAVASKDTIFVNYYGIVWGGTEPFDKSWSDDPAVSSAPTSFQIDTGAVIKGWDLALVGVNVGSRVLLTISPSDGYGSAGRAPSINGTDTLVFVIDLVDTLGLNTFGQADAVVQPVPANSPVVEGAPGSAPSLTIPAGLPEPTETRMDVLALGTGEIVPAGAKVYLQYGVWDWTGAALGTTWEQSGPQEVTLSDQIPELQGLVGKPLGSRVLLQMPADPSTGNPASAFVIDIVRMS